MVTLIVPVWLKACAAAPGMLPAWEASEVSEAVRKDISLSIQSVIKPLSILSLRYIFVFTVSPNSGIKLNHIMTAHDNADAKSCTGLLSLLDRNHLIFITCHRDTTPSICEMKRNTKAKLLSNWIQTFL